MTTQTPNNAFDSLLHSAHFLALHALTEILQTATDVKIRLLAASRILAFKLPKSSLTGPFTGCPPLPAVATSKSLPTLVAAAIASVPPQSGPPNPTPLPTGSPPPLLTSKPSPAAALRAAASGPLIPATPTPTATTSAATTRPTAHTLHPSAARQTPFPTFDSRPNSAPPHADTIATPHASAPRHSR